MRYKLIVISFLMAHSFYVSAQESKNEKTDERAQSVYVELLGNGLMLSANFDSRFNKSEKGFGFRIGIGTVIGIFSSFLTIPVGINHLTGKAPHYLESGVGVTYVSGSFSLFGDNKVSDFVFIPSIGYRFQPSGKSFTGRAFISPVIGGGGVQGWGGVSGGFKF